MNWLLDDQHLDRYLQRGARPKGAGRNAQLYTTGYWYVRLCQAVLGGGARGVLSATFRGLTPTHQERALAALVQLPDEIGLVSLRDLGPVIGELRQRHDLNVLSSEALAASMYLGAKVALSVRSPRLEAALASEGASFVVV